VHATGIEANDLREASLSGARWVSLARLVGEVATVGSSVVLARLISPAEFGRAAIALGFAAVALGLAWVGLGSALIQLRSIEPEDAEVSTLLSVTLGAALSAVTLFLLAPYAIAPTFGERVAYLLELVSPVFLLSGIGTVPNALLQRRLAFRRLSQIDIASTIAGLAAAVALAAAAGLDGEAIVLGTVTTACVATAFTLLSSRPARPTPRAR